MDETFLININAEELRRYQSGKVIGLIYIQNGSALFPDDLWEDFVVIILDWWVEAATLLLTGSSEYEEFRFMDGPFEMHVELLEGNECAVTWIHQDKEISSFPLALDVLVEQVMKAADKAISKCRAEKWESDDLDSLISHHKVLATAVSNTPKTEK